jgi:predicted Zn-dependent protease with MMP-like domain
LRQPLLSAGVPNARSRAEQFDVAVLQAVGDLEEDWADALTAIEFAVDEVPPLPAGEVLPSPDVVLDGGVPLTRFVPPGLDQRGRPTRARIVIYRRPVEGRASDAADLADLVAEVLREQVSAVLGEPDDIE